MGLVVLSCAILSAVVGFNVRVNFGSQIFAFFISLIILSFLFGFYFRGKFSIVRSLPSIATVSEPFEYSIEITNSYTQNQEGLEILDRLSSDFPEYADFIKMPIPNGVTKNFFDRYIGYPKWIWYVKKLRGGDSVISEVPVIAAGKTISINISFTPIRRGYIRFVGTDILRKDPFGLFRAIKKIENENSILVLPKRYKVPYFDLHGGSLYQQGGVVLSSSLGESEEFVSLREYRPGDSLRSIHWKSWAKTGKPVIRETQPEYFTRNALILDTIVASDKDQYFEEAVSLASSFLCSLDLQETLLDLIFVGDKPYKYTAGRGVATQNSLLKVVACAERSPDTEFESLQATVVANSKQISGAILVLVGYDEKRIELVNYLRGIGIRLLVFSICDESQVDNLSEKYPGIFFLPEGNIQKYLDAEINSANEENR